MFVIDHYDLVPTLLTIKWRLTAGKVKKVGIGHKTSTSRRRRALTDGYAILRDDIGSEETDLTIHSQFDSSVSTIFVLFAYEGDLQHPTASSSEDQIKIDGNKSKTSLKQF